MKFFILFTFSLLFASILSSNSSIKIIPPQSKYDSSHDYFEGLLSLIIKNSDSLSNKKIIFSKRMEQGRAFVALKNGNLDIHWAGTSIQREKEFLAIKIPLLKGLLGYRFFIINKNKKDTFDKINTLNDLKKLKACQGTHWPDTKILENSGLNVVKNINYEAMFLQVQSNRCNYFPRGIHEIVSEIKSRKNRYPKLEMYDDLILYYSFPMYFFVSKKNKEFAKQIEDGFLKLIKDGLFDEYLKNHETTKHLFPLDTWINKRMFRLNNPYIQIDEKFYNDKFWILK